MYILLVDDERDLRESVADLLEFEGYRVAQACDGAQALQILQTLPAASLVLLDLVMPVMDGWQFLESLKQRDRVPPPVCVLSAHYDIAARMGYPVHEVVTKPVDAQRLLRVVSRYCRRNPS